MLETFKKIRGFNYEISTKGRVRSLFTGKILKDSDGYGYRRVTLTKNGKQYGKFVHCLVASAFIPKVKGKPLVNHKDEVKTNNKVSNLEWCTPSYNNTYNDVHLKRGLARRGIPAHNKGKTNFISAAARLKISEARKRIGFVGNQYTK